MLAGYESKIQLVLGVFHWILVAWTSAVDKVRANSSIDKHTCTVVHILRTVYFDFIHTVLPNFSWYLPSKRQNVPQSSFGSSHSEVLEKNTMHNPPCLLKWIHSCWFRSFIPKINKIYCAIDGQPGEFVDKSYRVFNFNCLFKQYVMEWSVPV